MASLLSNMQEETPEARTVMMENSRVQAIHYYHNKNKNNTIASGSGNSNMPWNQTPTSTAVLWARTTTNNDHTEEEEEEEEEYQQRHQQQLIHRGARKDVVPPSPCKKKKKISLRGAFLENSQNEKDYYHEGSPHLFCYQGGTAMTDIKSEATTVVATNRKRNKKKNKKGGTGGLVKAMVQKLNVFPKKKNNHNKDLLQTPPRLHRGANNHNNNGTSATLLTNTPPTWSRTPQKSVGGQDYDYDDYDVMDDGSNSSVSSPLRRGSLFATTEDNNHNNNKSASSNPIDLDDTPSSSSLDSEQDNKEDDLVVDLDETPSSAPSDERVTTSNHYYDDHHDHVTTGTSTTSEEEELMGLRTLPNFSDDEEEEEEELEEVLYNYNHNDQNNKDDLVADITIASNYNYDTSLVMPQYEAKFRTTTTTTTNNKAVEPEDAEDSPNHTAAAAPTSCQVQWNTTRDDPNVSTWQEQYEAQLPLPAQDYQHYDSITPVKANNNANKGVDDDGVDDDVEDDEEEQRSKYNKIQVLLKPTYEHAPDVSMIQEQYEAQLQREPSMVSEEDLSMNVSHLNDSMGPNTNSNSNNNKVMVVPEELETIMMVSNSTLSSPPGTLSLVQKARNEWAQSISQSRHQRSRLPLQKDMQQFIASSSKPVTTDTSSGPVDLDDTIETTHSGRLVLTKDYALENAKEGPVDLDDTVETTRSGRLVLKKMKPVAEESSEGPRDHDGPVDLDDTVETTSDGSVVVDRPRESGPVDLDDTVETTLDGMEILRCHSGPVDLDDTIETTTSDCLVVEGGAFATKDTNKSNQSSPEDDDAIDIVMQPRPYSGPVDLDDSIVTSFSEGFADEPRYSKPVHLKENPFGRRSTTGPVDLDDSIDSSKDGSIVSLHRQRAYEPVGSKRKDDMTAEDMINMEQFGPSFFRHKRQMQESSGAGSNRGYEILYSESLDEDLDDSMAWSKNGSFTHSRGSTASTAKVKNCNKSSSLPLALKETSGLSKQSSDTIVLKHVIRDLNPTEPVESENSLVASSVKNETPSVTDDSKTKSKVLLVGTQNEVECKLNKTNSCEYSFSEVPSSDAMRTRSNDGPFESERIDLDAAIAQASADAMLPRPDDDPFESERIDLDAAVAQASADATANAGKRSLQSFKLRPPSSFPGKRTGLAVVLEEPRSRRSEDTYRGPVDLDVTIDTTELVEYDTAEEANAIVPEQWNPKFDDDDDDDDEVPGRWSSGLKKSNRSDSPESSSFPSSPDDSEKEDTTERSGCGIEIHHLEKEILTPTSKPLKLSPSPKDKHFVSQAALLTKRQQNGKDAFSMNLASIRSPKDPSTSTAADSSLRSSSSRLAVSAPSPTNLSSQYRQEVDAASTLGRTANRKEAAITIQTFWRARYCRVSFVNLVADIVLIQSHVRKWLVQRLKDQKSRDSWSAEQILQDIDSNEAVKDSSASVSKYAQPGFRKFQKIRFKQKCSTTSCNERDASKPLVPNPDVADDIFGIDDSGRSGLMEDSNATEASMDSNKFARESFERATCQNDELFLTVKAGERSGGMNNDSGECTALEIQRFKKLYSEQQSMNTSNDKSASKDEDTMTSSAVGDMITAQENYADVLGELHRVFDKTKNNDSTEKLHDEAGSLAPTEPTQPKSGEGEIAIIRQEIKEARAAAALAKENRDPDKLAEEIKKLQTAALALRKAEANVRPLSDSTTKEQDELSDRPVGIDTNHNSAETSSNSDCLSSSTGTVSTLTDEKLNTSSTSANHEAAPIQCTEHEQNNAVDSSFSDLASNRQFSFDSLVKPLTPIHETSHNSDDTRFASFAKEDTTPKAKNSSVPRTGLPHHHVDGDLSSRSPTSSKNIDDGTSFRPRRTAAYTPTLSLSQFKAKSKVMDQIRRLKDSKRGRSRNRGMARRILSKGKLTPPATKPKTYSSSSEMVAYDYRKCAENSLPTISAVPTQTPSKTPCTPRKKENLSLLRQPSVSGANDSCYFEADFSHLDAKANKGDQYQTDENFFVADFSQVESSESSKASTENGATSSPLISDTDMERAVYVSAPQKPLQTRPYTFGPAPDTVDFSAEAEEDATRRIVKKEEAMMRYLMNGLMAQSPNCSEDDLDNRGSLMAITGFADVPDTSGLRVEQLFPDNSDEGKAAKYEKDQLHLTDDSGYTSASPDPHFDHLVEALVHNNGKESGDEDAHNSLLASLSQRSSSTAPDPSLEVMDSSDSYDQNNHSMSTLRNIQNSIVVETVGYEEEFSVMDNNNNDKQVSSTPKNSKKPDPTSYSPKTPQTKNTREGSDMMMIAKSAPRKDYHKQKRNDPPQQQQSRLFPGPLFEGPFSVFRDIMMMGGGGGGGGTSSSSPSSWNALPAISNVKSEMSELTESMITEAMSVEWTLDDLPQPPKTAGDHHNHNHHPSMPMQPIVEDSFGEQQQQQQGTPLSRKRTPKRSSPAGVTEIHNHQQRRGFSIFPDDAEI